MAKTHFEKLLKFPVYLPIEKVSFSPRGELFFATVTSGQNLLLTSLYQLEPGKKVWGSSIEEVS